MKTLNVPFSDKLIADKHKLQELADELSGNKLDYTSWDDFPYKPNVVFKIAYSKDALFLSFDVEEKALRINNFASNDPVYEDSCVEFFISFTDQYYYNLEFNAIGVGLVGYGTNDKNNRKRLSSERINEIKTFSTITKSGRDENVKWNLQLYISLGLFEEENILDLADKSFRANFYKCGDLLPEPHFLSWAPIQADEPNFHLPEYFGLVKF